MQSVSVLELVREERSGRHGATDVGSASFPVFSAVSNVGNTYFSTHLAHGAPQGCRVHGIISVCLPYQSPPTQHCGSTEAV